MGISQMVGAEDIDIFLDEDSKFFRTVIKKQLEEELGFRVTCAANYTDAREILNKPGDEFFLALIDRKLPDGPNGEIVDFVIKKSVPAVVFSAEFNEDLRDYLLQKNIIDYVVKDNPASIDYIISTVKRLYQNQFIKVLMVDDSRTARYTMCSLLVRYKFQVLEASDGLEALKIIEETPGIHLVITDFRMDNLDGFELTKKIRAQYSMNDISIIGVSAYGNQSLSAKFIKAGANDFLTKQFLNEEFFSVK